MLNDLIFTPKTKRLLGGRFFAACLLFSGVVVSNNPAFAKPAKAKVNIALSVAANPGPHKTEEKLAKSLTGALNTEGVEVQVFTGKDGVTTAVLSGNLDDQNSVRELEARANKLVPSVVGRVISLLQVRPAEPQMLPTDADEVVTAIWQRTFIPSSVTSTAGDGTPVGGRRAEERAQELAGILSQMHGEKDLVVAQGSGTFFLHGPRAQVVAVQRDLLSIDALWPQVQMDFWTVQVSGSPQKIAEDTTRIRQRFDNARKAMQLVQSDLAAAVQSFEGTSYFESHDDLFSEDENNGLLTRIGFNPDSRRPLSLTESLIFLGLQTRLIPNPDLWRAPQQSQIPARQYVIAQLQNQVARDLNANGALLTALSDECKTNGRADPSKLLPILRATYSNNWASDRAGVVQFAKAVFNVYNPQGRSSKQQERDIATLRTTAAASDRLLKSVTDAFASDMQEMFLKPLFDANAKTAVSRASGTTLTGQARLVVTSRIETGINPRVTSYVETTRPKPLDAAFLNNVFATPPASGAPATSTTPAASPSSAVGALATRFAGLSQLELLGLGAAISQPDPEITRVSPGVAINVRPTVLPDGGSARLQLDFNFGVETKVMNAITTGSGRIESVPADGIASNHVRTDITVNSFDLFNVSSFAIESSHPRSRYLPVIGSIPLLGELIKKPAKNTVTRHESIVLVNTTILPRIMDLAHFYGQ